jgi:hypothetical protein
VKLLPTAIAALIASAFAPAALACTLCHSDAAAQARAIIFGPELASDLAGLAAPIPALILAVLAVGRLSR